MNVIELVIDLAKSLIKRFICRIRFSLEMTSCQTILWENTRENLTMAFNNKFFVFCCKFLWHHMILVQTYFPFKADKVAYKQQPQSCAVCRNSYNSVRNKRERREKKTKLHLSFNILYRNFLTIRHGWLHLLASYPSHVQINRLSVNWLCRQGETTFLMVFERQSIMSFNTVCNKAFFLIWCMRFWKDFCLTFLCH